MQPIPGNITTTAVLQLVSGLINLFGMAWLVFFGGTTACSFLGGLFTSLISLGTCPIGVFAGFCGFAGCILVPIGIAEIIAGIMGIASPKSGARMMKIVAWFELASLLGGGFLSFLVGGAAVFMLGSGEVKAYLANPNP